MEDSGSMSPFSRHKGHRIALDKLHTYLIKLHLIFFEKVSV